MKALFMNVAHHAVDALRTIGILTPHPLVSNDLSAARDRNSRAQENLKQAMDKLGPIHELETKRGK